MSDLNDQLLALVEYAHNNSLNEAKEWLEESRPFKTITRTYRIEKHWKDGKRDVPVYRIYVMYPNPEKGGLVVQGMIELDANDYESADDALFDGIASFALGEKTSADKNTCMHPIPY